MTVPDLANPVFAMIYAGAAEALAEEGYALVISSDSLLLTGDDDDDERIEEVNGMLLDRHVDGWIMADAHLTNMLPDAISSEATPTVLVNRRSNLIAAPTIVADDHVGVGLVIRHLVALGHTAIAHVAGPEDISGGATRRQAFVEWMQAEGLEIPDALIVQTNAFVTAAGRGACAKLLDSGEPFTAIVAANDLIALGCYDTLSARGIEVPREMSITGYDDMAFTDRVDPPLTTVSLPYYEMGISSGRAMLSLLADPGAMAEPVDEDPTLLLPSLALRSSTAPPHPRTG